MIQKSQVDIKCHDFINKYLPTSLFNIYKSINTLFEMNLLITIIVDCERFFECLQPYC